MSCEIPSWGAKEENFGEQVLLWFWLIFSAWVWMLLTSNWNFPTFPFIRWPCCSGKCVLHMYIEVEPGLIAVHTLPEDIERLAIFFFLKNEEKKKGWRAYGYDYVRMLSTKAPKWTQASPQSRLYYKNRADQNIYVKFRGFLQSDTFISAKCDVWMGNICKRHTCLCH